MRAWTRRIPIWFGFTSGASIAIFFYNGPELSRNRLEGLLDQATISRGG